MRRVLLCLGALLLLAACVAAATGTAIVRRAFPQVTGTLAVPGLRAPVEILRDRWGVPHLYARNAHDLFFAQGYVHAQDRLWQMDFNRRVPSGRLSEIFGEATLPADRFMRTIGLRRAAEEEWAGLDPESRDALGAYAAGVNALLAQHGGLPVEFVVLRYRPDPWGPVDCLAYSKLLDWTLSDTWEFQLLRAHLMSRFGPEGTRSLVPPSSRDTPVVVPEGAQFRSWNEAATLRLLELGDRPRGIGSNNWVVSGAHTDTGHPLLANDPHLEAQMPSVWYEMHLVGGPYNVTGATLPGVPGVIIGHNENIAWGVTNAGPDVQDLYMERFDPGDPTRYLYRGRWEAARVIREQILVRRRPEPVVHTVRITRHGPIMNDVVEGLGAFLALRWTALEPGTASASVLRLNRARTWGEFRDALRLWTVPAQNFVYADREGNIGYQLPGRIPIRAKGDGLLPVPGWTGDYEWAGEIPFDRLPSMLNPARGYIVTANNRIVPDDYPYLIAQQWDPGFRARRIETLLDGEGQASVSLMERIQYDVQSLPGRATIRALDGLRLSGEPEAGLLAELRSWDGALRPDSRPAAIYEVFRMALVELLFRGALGADLYPRYLKHSEFWQPVLVRLMQDPSSHWWRPGGRDAVVAQALARAHDMLTRRLGPNPSTWTWGRLHAMRFVHPLGHIRALAWVFNASASPTGGDLFTVNNGGFQADTYAQIIVASYRQIIDLADWDRSLAMHTTGQSGLPFHPHYRDFVPLWAAGRYHPMLFSRNRIEQESRARLRLVPP